MSVYSWKCRVKSQELVAPRFIGAALDLEPGVKAWTLTQARKPQTRKAGLRYPASKMTGEGASR
jgi:hypothetical protein